MDRPLPVQFGEWRPDLAMLDNQFAGEALNVFADGNSYTPIPSPRRLLNTPIPTTPTQVVGLTFARTAGGGWKVYVGTRAKLYTVNLSTWTEVGTGYNVPATGEMWSGAQFGDKLVMAQLGDVPQVINVDSGTTFAALGGSPPIAHKVTQLGDFLVLSGLADGFTIGGIPTNRRQIVWSSINDIGAWTPGLNLCDLQEFPDGGPVQGVAGGEIGYVVQDRAIRTMQFLPGDTSTIFSFSRVVQDRGSTSEFGFATVANTLFFRAEDGFFSLAGAQLTPIGVDKVDEWFRNNSDPNRWNVVQAVISPRTTRLGWAFHRGGGSTTYDHLIIYDWLRQKWTHAAIFAQVWGALATPGLDLDTTGSEAGDALLDSTAMPLDSFAYVGGRPFLGIIDQDGYLCILDGPNLEATVETAEVHLVPGKRAFVNEVYPLVNSASDAPGQIQVGTRERLQGVQTWLSPVPIEQTTGSAYPFTSGRLHRFRLIVPAASTWDHAQGVLVNAQQDGTIGS